MWILNVLIVALTIGVVGSGCSSFHDSIFGLEDEYFNPYQEQAFAIMRGKCMTCHTAWQSYTEDAHYLAVGLVAKQDPDNSLIMSRVRYGGGQEDMPPLGSAAITEGEVDILRLWILNIGQEPEQPPPATNASTVSSSKIRIVDRKLAGSILRTIFGPAGFPIVRNHIENRVSSFQRNCDPMDPEDCANADIVDPYASVLTVSDTVRQGYVSVKACSELVYNDTAVSFAITQATGLSNLTYLNTEPMPTDPQIQAARKLFVPGGADLPSNVMAKIRALAAGAIEAGKPLDPWRYVFYLFCQSPGWQMI